MSRDHWTGTWGVADQEQPCQVAEDLGVQGHERWDWGGASLAVLTDKYGVPHLAENGQGECTRPKGKCQYPCEEGAMDDSPIHRHIRARVGPIDRRGELARLPSKA